MSADQKTKHLFLKGSVFLPALPLAGFTVLIRLDSQISFYKLKDASLIPKEVHSF